MIPGMTESTQANLSTEVVENTPSPSLDGRSYTVKKGDTLSHCQKSEGEVVRIAQSKWNVHVLDYQTRASFSGAR